jgi:uroporphyrinogen decarboxylase
MTPLERWLAVLNHELPDRVPLDYSATPEATKKLMDYLGATSMEELYDRLHIDRKVGVGPRYVGPKLPDKEDVFGCRFQDVDYGTGVYNECVYNPLANYRSVREIEANYRWPNPDWWDYSDIPAQVKGKDDLPVVGGGSEPFLIYKYLRGMEQAYMDLLLEPEIVHYCLDKLFDLAYENTRRIYEQVPGKVTYGCVAEDLGSQQSLLISAAQIREFLLPRMKRIMDLVHEAGAFVYHHSDGAIRAILPDMIQAGIKVLNPVQWRCKGMDREGLKADFGDRIALHGAMDNQYTLAFGTVAEVRQEVLDNIRILGAGGGYILAPCHNIQAVSPPENIVAMYDTAYENGWY